MPGEWQHEALPELQVASPGSSRETARVALPSPGVLLPPRAIPVAGVRVTRFRFEGNTLFKDKELAALVDDFLNRELQEEDIDEIAYRLTLHHVNKGYISSGVTIPDRRPRDGELEIVITEGRLTMVIVQGTQRLAKWYARQRVRRGSDEPLHFPTLQHQLQILQTDPNIRRINAELKPSHLPGEATLLMEIAESPTWTCGLDFHNYQQPDTGAEQLELWANCQNLTGAGDYLQVRRGLLSGGVDDPGFAGLDNFTGRYRLPILADDTQFELYGQTRDHVVVDESFQELEIEGSTWLAGTGLRRPLMRRFDNELSIQSELWAGVSLDRQHSESTLLGQPFSPSPGYVNGELDLTIVRMNLEWTKRSRGSVFALQGTFSQGLDMFGATQSPIEPDEDFFTCRLNGQYLRRVRERGDLLVVKGGFQVSNDGVPSPEQWTLGGRHTIRGYRENTLLSDNGACLGVEYRYPLIDPDSASSWRISMVPFLDAGYAWTKDGDDDDWLASAGLGLMMEHSRFGSGEIFWGVPFHRRGDHKGNLQDAGIHFRITLKPF